MSNAEMEGSAWYDGAVMNPMWQCGTCHEWVAFGVHHTCAGKWEWIATGMDITAEDRIASALERIASALETHNAKEPE